MTPGLTITNRGFQGPMYPNIPAALNRRLNPNVASKQLANASADWNQFCHDKKNEQLNFNKPSPIERMPPGGREIQEMAALPLSSVPSTSTDTAILTFKVPIGYDAIITHVTNTFANGTGFIEGTGGIVWRVRVGNVFARNLGNILFSFGSLSEPFVIPGVGIPAISGQTITYYVNIPVTSPVSGASAQIVCAIFGWAWPRG